MQQGPCLPHCFRCTPVTAVLARTSIAYAVMCAVYLVLTRDLGTPLKDSLTPEQQEIKGVSARERRHRAAIGLVVGIIVAHYVPLHRIASY